MGAAPSTHPKNLALAMRLAEKGFQDIPVETEVSSVSFYMPPTFPLEICLSQNHLDLCRRSWKTIVKGTAQGMQNSQGRSGIVLFYDEFYFRLFQRAQVFKQIFPNMQKRGEVLTKAMGFMLTLTGSDSREENLRIAQLAFAHHFKLVRPWHFSVYCEVCIEVIIYWSGHDATFECGESWTCLMAYLLRRMLSTYLIGKIDETEFYQNTGEALAANSMKDAGGKGADAKGGKHNKQNGGGIMSEKHKAKEKPHKKEGSGSKQSDRKAARVSIEPPPEAPPAQKTPKASSPKALSSKKSAVAKEVLKAAREARASGDAAAATATASAGPAAGTATARTAAATVAVEGGAASPMPPPGMAADEGGDEWAPLHVRKTWAAQSQDSADASAGGEGGMRNGRNSSTVRRSVRIRETHEFPAQQHH